MQQRRPPRPDVLGSVVTRTTLRVGAALATVASALALGVAMGAHPAAATDQTVFNVPSTGGSRTYPGIAVQGAGSEAAIADSSTVENVCENQKQSCDKVPIKVAFPKGVDPKSVESKITVEIKWSQDGAGAGNDLDVYAWYFGTPEGTQAAPANHYTGSKSATGDDPEKLTTIRAEFFLYVFNYQGVNTGYTVKVTPTFKVLAPPSEPTDPPTSGFSVGGGPTTAVTFGATTTTTRPGPTTTVADGIAPTSGDTTVQPLVPIGVAGSPAPINLVGKRKGVKIDDNLSTGVSETVQAIGPASTGAVLGVLAGIPIALGIGGGLLLRVGGTKRVKITTDAAQLPTADPPA